MIIIGKRYDPHFVRVFFKEISEGELELWGDCKLLVVQPEKPFFRITTISEFLVNKNAFHPLEYFFKTDKELIKNYTELLKKISLKK